MGNFTKNLCAVERDRVTAAEICIDEILTIMDRHGVINQMRSDLAKLSGDLHFMLTETDGVNARRERLIRVRSALTNAMPMTDEDLGNGDAQLSV